MATGRTFVFWSMRFDARSPWQNARASEMRNGHLSMMYVIMKPLSLRCDTVRASNRIKFKRKKSAARSHHTDLFDHGV